MTSVRDLGSGKQIRVGHPASLPSRPGCHPASKRPATAFHGLPCREGVAVNRNGDAATNRSSRVRRWAGGSAIRGGGGRRRES